MIKRDSELIVNAELKNVMEDFYLKYAIAVISNRALPDIRDGLKPVHRRILYAARDLKIYSNASFRKSSALVGHVLGQYHPHGDSSVYGSVVLLAQDFYMRYPLFEGQGNFGSIDGDDAAAARYTEIRLSKYGEVLLKDVENTVDFIPNYDEEFLEPVVLPSKIPNMLMNGTEGLAVAMSTDAPPHNLTEIVKALEVITTKKKYTIEDILDVMPGPDFPTGGVIRVNDGIKDYYETGIGRFAVESKWNLEKQGKYNLICFTEIPYRVNKSRIIERVALTIDREQFPGLISVEDESTMSGIRIVVKTEPDVDIEKAVKFLFQKTPLSANFNAKYLALDKEGKPRYYSIIDSLEYYMSHQVDVYRKEAESKITALDRQIKIAEALIAASSKIREVVDIIEKSRDTKSVKNKLKKLLSVDDESVEYILSLQLRRIQRIEKKKQEDDLKKYKEDKKEFEKWLSDDKYLKSVIINFLKKTAVEIDDGRKTKITDGEMEIVSGTKDIVVLYNQDTITVKDEGYTIKKSDENNNIGAFNSTTGSITLVVEKDGTMHSVNNYEMSDTVNRFDNIATILSVDYNGEFENIYLFTKNGMVKSFTKELLFDTISRRNSFTCINVIDGDEVIEAFSGMSNDNVIAYNNQDRFIRAELSDVRPTGLSSMGVNFMRMDPDGEVLGVSNTNGKRKLYYINQDENTEEVDLETINIQKRAGQGRMLFGNKAAIAANFKNELFGIHKNNPKVVK